MSKHIVVLLESFTVLTLCVESFAGFLFEPHGLVVMDVDIVSAVPHEDVHDVFTLLDVTSLEVVHGCDGVDSSVSSVKLTCFLMELSSLLPVTSLLEDPTLEGVELKESWSVSNSQVDIVECLGNIPLVHVVV